MAIVYNVQGEAVEIDSVDAREYIATGQWFDVKPKSEELKEGSSLTINEIKAKLAESGIEIPDGVTKKADLLALLG